MMTMLEAIGIVKLSDLKGADPQELALRINVHLGRNHINRNGVSALENLVAAAGQERP